MLPSPTENIPISYVPTFGMGCAYFILCLSLEYLVVRVSILFVNASGAFILVFIFAALLYTPVINL